MPKCRLRPSYSPASTLAAAVDQRERRGREVGGAADQLGHLAGRPLDHLLGGLAGGDHAGVRALAAARRRRSRRAARRASMRSSSGRGCGRRELPLPLAPAARAPRSTHSAEVRERLVGDEERLQARVAVDLLGEPDLLVAERRAVRVVRVLLVRRAGRDVRAHDDQARAVGRPPARSGPPARGGRARCPRAGSGRASRRPRSASPTSSEKASSVSPSIEMWLSS